MAENVIDASNHEDPIVARPHLRDSKLVQRHLRYGDIVPFHRQPPLHKPSLMASIKSKYMALDLTWLLECSQLMRDLAESPLEEDKGEHAGNSSLAERVARTYPKFSVCAKDESDWRLVAKVIHEWSVDPVPFWFYDGLVWIPTKDNSKTVEALNALVAEHAEVPHMHEFWRGLLALADGGSLPNMQNIGYYTRFWLCLRAYAHSRDPRFLEYWTQHLMRSTTMFRYVHDTADFVECVVDARDLRALREVLQEVRRCGVEMTHARVLFEGVFTVDWVEAWDEMDRFYGSDLVFTSNEGPVASHPAAVKWAFAFMGRRFARWCVFYGESWFARCVVAMVSAQRLADFDLEIVPGQWLFSILVDCLDLCERISIGAIVQCLREAYQKDGERRERHTSMLTDLAWTLITCEEPDGDLVDNVSRKCVTLEHLHQNGLFVLPAVDSDIGALRFAEFVVGGEGEILPRGMLAVVVGEFPVDEQQERRITAKWRASDDWKPFCGIRLRARIHMLNAFGWGTDLVQLRAMVDRLVAVEYGGQGGARASLDSHYVLRVRTDEFMELLDADSEVARRVKRLKCA